MEIMKHQQYNAQKQLREAVIKTSANISVKDNTACTILQREFLRNARKTKSAETRIY